jgi:hypothetical protein
MCAMHISGFVYGAGEARENSISGIICLPPDFTGADGKALFFRIVRDFGDKVGTLRSDAHKVREVDCCRARNRLQRYPKFALELGR